jgi:hypothetical protein
LGKSLLLISDRPDDQAFAVEVAITAGLSLVTIADPKLAADHIARDGADVIFIDASTREKYAAVEAAIQESVGIFSDRVDANAIHFFSSHDLSKSIYLVQSPLFGNFVLRNYGDPKDTGAHYGRIVKATLSETAFGTEKLLKEGTKIQVVKLETSQQKQEAVEAVRNYLIAAKFQPRMCAMIANSVDEILMNAIFAAPVDDAGRPTMTQTSRATHFKLEGKHEVHMRIGFDGKHVAITAVDRFGSLDRAKLLSHFAKRYNEDRLKLTAAIANAGLGLATIFRNGGSFFFVSESGVQTEVSVIYEKVDDYRHFRSQFRFISTQFKF